MELQREIPGINDNKESKIAYLVEEIEDPSLLDLEVEELFVAGHAQHVRVPLLLRLADQKSAIVSSVVAQQVDRLSRTKLCFSSLIQSHKTGLYIS